MKEGRLRKVWALATAAGWMLIGLAAAGAQEDEPAPAPRVTLEEIVVEPADPGPDTLCRLRVKLRNQGTETASQFGFKVTINGSDLVVYGNQLFMYPVGPGKTEEIQLYNFWSTETSRPTPADSKLAIEVALTEAVWMKIETDAEGVEVWTPLDPVPGLPSARQITLQMKKPG